MNPLFYLQSGNLTVGDESTTDAAEMAGETVEKTQTIIDVMIDSWYIMGPLFILSILAVYVFFERTMAISRALKERITSSRKLKIISTMENLILQEIYVELQIHQ